jgi:hypothetical protein
MAEYWKLSRLYLLLLLIFAAGRWYLGNVRDVAFEKATDKVSIVILTLFASLFYAAFCRRWRGFGLLRVLALTSLLALMGQIVVLVSTIVSYAAGIESYFNHPTALQSAGPVSFGQALVVRAQGIFANVVLNIIAGILGWVMGALLPEPR